MARRDFGSVTKLPSGRYRARYKQEGAWHSASTTFPTKSDAVAWLSTVQADLVRGLWTDPSGGRETLATYAETWLAQRHDLRPRTAELYQGLLANHIKPTLGNAKLQKIQTATIRSWHASIAADRAVTAAKAYRLLRTILGTAVSDGLIPTNPCTLKGAGTEHSPERQIPSLETVNAIVGTLPERYGALVLTAALGGLRAGELRGLLRRNVDLVHSTVTIEQQALRLVGRGRVTGLPKSRAGLRTIAIPPSLVAALDEHLAKYVDLKPDSSVFTGDNGGPVTWSHFSKLFRQAAIEAGAEGLHFHDLRHLAGTLAAATGASTRELMARLGHSSPRAALIYQHATAERDHEIAGGIEAILQAARTAPLAPIVRISQSRSGGRTPSR